MKIRNSNSIYFKTSFVNLIITLAIFAVAIPFFFFKLMDIPLGILIGGLFGTVLYFLIYKFEERKLQLTIILIIVKFILYLLITIGLCFLYLKADIKVINPFSFMGMYIVPTILLIVFKGKEKDDAKSL